MKRYRLGFFNFSQLAVVAFVVTALLAILDFRDRSTVNRILTEQQTLLLLKNQLSQTTKCLLRARLSESQLINTKKSAFFTIFQAKLEETETSTQSLIQAFAETDIVEPLENIMVHLENYQRSVTNIHSLQQEMGLDNNDGILTQLQTSNQNITEYLDLAGQKDLIFEFVHLQIDEKDFSSTLDMRLASQLNKQLDNVDAAIQIANLASDLKELLLSEIDLHGNLISSFINSTIELELSIAESTLHYDRIAPEITLSQTKIDALLNDTSMQLRSQRRSSNIQTIIVFISVFVVLLGLVVGQLQSARRLKKRLQQLAQGMQEVAAGHFEGIGELPQGQDDVGTLAETFSAMATQIREQITVIQKSQEKAEIASQAKSNFLANMSHELRTPLNAILGFTQVMQHSHGLTTEQYKQLNIINKSGAHLLALINDVLDMSKIEAGKSTLNEQSFNLPQLLDTLRDMLQFKAQEKGIQLIVVCAPDLPQQIWADQQKLRQILINLLGNALKFTEQGQVELQVMIAPELAEADKRAQSPPQSHTTLMFTVKDTGPGMTQAELGHLFDSFSQGEQGKQQGGTGLGMAISQNFVQLMGGEIQVQSVLGQGTQFSFTLPVAVQVIAPVLTEESRTIVALADNQPDYRILVVDNNPTSQLLMAELLQGVGFSVQTANNSQAALEHCAQWYPHLVWIDFNLPGIDGHATTRCLKSWAIAQPTSHWHLSSVSATVVQDFPMVIALTSKTFDLDRQRILAAGCCDVVRKPIQRQSILQKVATYLGVTYQYQDSIDQRMTMGRSPAPSPIAAIAPADFSVTTLQTMPLDWVRQLHDEACLAEQENIMALVAGIMDSHTALGLAIQHLVEKFDFGKIIVCTEQVLGHE